MGVIIFLKCSVLMIITATVSSVTTTHQRLNNELPNSNLVSHARFKRYNYPKPNNWGYTFSSFGHETSYKQDSSYGYTHNNPYDFNNNYFYNNPGINPPASNEYLKPAEHYRPHEIPYDYTQQNAGEFVDRQGPNQSDQSFFTQKAPPPPFQPSEENNTPLATDTGPNVDSRIEDYDVGAFISPSIFGQDSVNENITVSPTGLFVPKLTRTSFAYAAQSINCNKPFQRPSMPNFNSPGRRVSDVSNSQRVKRSKPELPELNWPQEQYSPQQGDTQISWFQHNWSQENGGYLNGQYQQSIPQEFAPPQNLYNPMDRTQIDGNGGKKTMKTSETTQNIAFGINFQQAKAEEFPHMAAIGWRSISDDYVFKCGGSIISRNFVVTAAHCTASAPDTSLTDIVPRIVRVGDISIAFESDGQTFKETRRRRQAGNSDRLDVGIKNIIKHEQYDPLMKYYDIALLELEYQLQFTKNLQPACLWTDRKTSDRVRRAVAAGWGVVDVATSRTSTALQAGELDIIGLETCNKLLEPSFGKKFNQVVDHQICAGKLSGGKDVCQGDSGGPLQVKIQLPIKTQGSMHTILGIISAGVGCAKADTPGVYTRITSFVDWIEKIVWP